VPQGAITKKVLGLKKCIEEKVKEEVHSAPGQNPKTVTARTSKVGVASENFELQVKY